LFRTACQIGNPIGAFFKVEHLKPAKHFVQRFPGSGNVGHARKSAAYNVTCGLNLGNLGGRFDHSGLTQDTIVPCYLAPTYLTAQTLEICQRNACMRLVPVRHPDGAVAGGEFVQRVSQQ
jgi:hypothetical protein